MLDYLPEDMDTVAGQNELLEEFNKGAFSLPQVTLRSRLTGAARSSPCSAPRTGSAPPRTLAFQYDLAFGILLIALGAVILLKPEGALDFIFAALGIAIFSDGLFKVQIALDYQRNAQRPADHRHGRLRTEDERRSHAAEDQRHHDISHFGDPHGGHAPHFHNS